VNNVFVLVLVLETDPLVAPWIAVLRLDQA
jgi:hypothetical protein